MPGVITDYLDLALQHAERGYYVHPVRCKDEGEKKPTKSPYVHDWENAATRDPAQIQRWWDRWPDALVAVAPGRSKLAVVDLRWIAAYDAEVRASEREDCDGCALLEKDVARFVAERDALAAQLDALRRARLVGDSFLSWHDFGHKVGRILDADPSTVLAERDAQKWDEGYRSGGSRAMRRMSDEPSVPDAVNPYRARAEREGNRD